MTKKKENTDALEDLVVRYVQAPQKGPAEGPDGFVRKVALRLRDRVSAKLTMAGKTRINEMVATAQPGEPPQDGGPWQRPRKIGGPSPGSILIRVWRNQEIRVSVLDHGYQWQDRVFKSLSALAREITGSRWNGRLFFGLVKRQRKTK